MVKVALLIGISEYGSGLKPLPGALRDIEAMEQVLQPSEKAGFDDVKCLSNPNPPVMREAMETFFSSRTKNDFLLLFFSGYIVQDNRDKLYFATSVTCKTPRTELIRVSAIPVSFVQDLITNSECQRVVIILDGCLSDMSVAEISQNNENLWHIQDELGGENRVMLSCFTSSHTSLEPEEFNHSIYSRYLIEGMETGIADLDNDGWIAVDELHQYANNKVQIIAPALKPEMYPVESKDKILLLSVLTDDPKLKYRKEVENWLNRGEISQAGRYILNKLSATLYLTSEDCTEIEANILMPFQEYQKKLQRYRGEYALTIANEYPTNSQIREQLKSFQQSLGLQNEDIAPIEERMALKLTNILSSKNDIEQLVQEEGESHFNSVPLTLEVVEESPPILEASENHVDELVLPDSESAIKSPPLPPSIVITEDNPIPVTTNLVVSNNASAATSTTPYKILLPLGVAGVLATVAVIAFSNRPPVVSPSVTPTQEITTSIKPLPSPSVLPEKRVCQVFINGNLRSEPAYFLDNVVESLREPLIVTGKQTKGGWVEVTMPNNKLAWAYGDIISEQDRKEMGECLKKNEIKIKIIEDMLPPASLPSP